MPVLFVGHGSPMNTLEDNAWTKLWRQIANALPTPQGIAVLSAHWYGEGVRVQADKKPEMLYDMYGFPEDLYAYQYPAENPLWLQERLLSRLPKATLQKKRGYDHGAYSVLAHFFPNANVPVCQISVDAFASPAEQIQLGKRLSPLRDDGILILASGNVVHNLRQARRDAEADEKAVAFDQAIASALEKRDDAALLAYEAMPGARFAVPYPDHLYPLLIAYGASRVTDRIHYFNRVVTMGSISMTSYLFGDVS